MKWVIYFLMTVNICFCTFEILYGHSIASIAIVSDAIDGFTDTLALLLGVLLVLIPLHSKIVRLGARTFFLDDFFK